MSFPPIPPQDSPGAQTYVAPATFTDGEPADHKPITLEPEAHVVPTLPESGVPLTEEPEGASSQPTDVVGDESESGD